MSRGLSRGEAERRGRQPCREGTRTLNLLLLGTQQSSQAAKEKTKGTVSIPKSQCLPSLPGCHSPCNERAGPPHY